MNLVTLIYFVLISVLSLSRTESTHVQMTTNKETIIEKEQNHSVADSLKEERTTKPQESGQESATEHPDHMVEKEHKSDETTPFEHGRKTSNCSLHCKKRKELLQTNDSVRRRRYTAGLLLKITNKTTAGYKATVKEVIASCSLLVHPNKTINITLPEMEVSQCPCPHLHVHNFYLVAGYTDANKQSLILSSVTFHIHIHTRRHHSSIRLERMKRMLSNMFSDNCPTSTPTLTLTPTTPTSNPTPKQQQH